WPFSKPSKNHPLLRYLTLLHYFLRSVMKASTQLSSSCMTRIFVEMFSKQNFFIINLKVLI
ncbi:hypothetical protein HK100_010744, partial [Physocladia obscura]